ECIRERNVTGVQTCALPISMEDLGMGEVFRNIADTPRGIVLVTGPTGSGKSTTLAALIDYINSHKYQHILTIEDPIEFVHESKRSEERRVGKDWMCSKYRGT